MLRILLTTLCGCLSLIAFSQTSYISGVVNSYYRVTAIAADKNSVVVDDATGLKRGDKIMVVQMKGATVNTANNSAFGSVTNLNNAGNYEINTICSISGNAVYLINKLMYTYDAGQKVQLVFIPQYQNAIVTAPLVAQPWDSLSGKGGVLAVSASQVLTLNAPVSTDGAGYKGGKFLKDNGTFCIGNFTSSYTHDPTSVSSQLGAYKGESIAVIATDVSGGRGAVANGGGGGNNHNTGGGGGANYGTGGIGGNNSSATCKSDYPGFGGYALSNTTKLFLGGGGGAGHGNNTMQAGGGNGGGIIFIEAGSLKSNTHKISADGATGSNTIGDGASGGGAGGTIIMHVTAYTDQPSISAKGGNGGLVDNENYSNRCYGDGGGGGGGIVYFKSNTVAGTIVSGGLKGGKIMSIGCADDGTSTNGGNGITVTNYIYNQSQTASTTCPEAVILPVQLIYFNASVKDGKVQLEWQVTDPQDAHRFIVLRKAGNEDWKELSVIKAQDIVSTYATADAILPKEKYQYRLKIVEKSGHVIYSSIRSITEQAGNTKGLNIFPNPASTTITVLYDFKKGDLFNILDATGKVVYQKKIMTNQVSLYQDVSFLAKGVYIIQVGPIVSRFTVQ